MVYMGWRRLAAIVHQEYPAGAGTHLTYWCAQPDTLMRVAARDVGIDNRFVSTRNILAVPSTCLR